jgi:hypothetical protein
MTKRDTDQVNSAATPTTPDRQVATYAKALRGTRKRAATRGAAGGKLSATGSEVVRKKFQKLDAARQESVRRSHDTYVDR